MSRVPRIRFKGFEEDWEQRKLISCLSLLKDGTHGTHKDYPSGPLLLSAKNIKNGRVNYDETDRRISYKDFEKIHSNFKLQVGDVLLTIVGSIGETALLQNTFGITFQRSVAFLRVTDNIIPEFLMSEINTSRFKNELENRKSTSAQPGIYLENLGEIPVFISKNSDEQLKIGSYFDSLNHLITLHQRKLEKLKIIKKSMLENLFPQNGEKTPKIRFSGFTKDWEQRKLGEIAERIIRKNEKLESTLPLTISAQYGLIDQNEFFDKRIASKDVRGYYLIKKGEFAYNKSTSVDAPLGAIKRLDKYKNGVLSTLYILFKIIDDTSTSSDYLVTYYATDLWHRGIQSIAAEGARNHGLLNIAPNDFFETMLSIPFNISEQKKVGDFFITLDHLITLHQSKLEKLQKIKKSMLESMFV